MLQKFPDLDNPVLRERLRQARLSFDLALVMTIATVVMGLGGVITNKLEAGAAMAVGGGTFTACCFKLAKDANDRLDRLASEPDDSLASSLLDETPDSIVRSTLG